MSQRPEECFISVFPLGLQDKVVNASFFIPAFRLPPLLVFVYLPLAAELHGPDLDEDGRHSVRFRLRVCLTPTQSFLDLQIDGAVVARTHELSDPILPFLGSATRSTCRPLSIVISIIYVCSSRVCLGDLLLFSPWEGIVQVVEVGGAATDSYSTQIRQQSVQVLALHHLVVYDE